MYVCMYVCMCVRMYIYIYIYMPTSSAVTLQHGESCSSSLSSSLLIATCDLLPLADKVAHCSAFIGLFHIIYHVLNYTSMEIYRFIIYLFKIIFIDNYRPNQNLTD